jgi:acyl-coenzyme A synthetase/AMP-(fatty) acid ligase
MLGGRLPTALRRAALTRLAGGIVDHYGTNEAGLICVLDDEGRGAPVPGQSVAVVGPDGRLAAVGETGRVAVRGPAVAAGYLDAPALTARHFRNGWFLTDDLAEVLTAGRLRLVGRSEDVLNFGGHKVACADLEAALRDKAGLADVAILPGEDGASPVIACVLPDAANWAQTVGRVRASLPALLADATLRAVAAIPRTPEGKVRRPHLRAVLEG